MDFRKITIPYTGREEYPSNGGGESVRTIISNYLGGMSSSGGGQSQGGGSTNPSQGGDAENRGTNATSFFAFLSKTSGTYSAIDLAQGAVTDTIYITGYRNNEQAQTLVGDISNSAATTTFDIIGLPSTGMSVDVVGNGTTGASLVLTVTSEIAEDSGTLTIPVAVNINQNQIDPYHATWHDQSNKCVQMTLKFSWTINRAASGDYVLDLSNQMAEVNCDSAGTLYPASIATLQCTASTHYNGSLATGITYSAHTRDAFAATGFSINQTSGVLTFNYGDRERFYWNPNYPALPIDIIAYKDGTAIATKTMTISRNYPAPDGTPAHTRYIVTDADVINYNPVTSAYSKTQVVGRVMLQVGDQLPVYDSSTTIYQWYNDLETGKTQAQGSITASTTYANLKSITFALKNSNGEYYEREDVPVISSGERGPQGTSGQSAWYLTLTNDNASVNCDSEGNILPGAATGITCQAKLYSGSTRYTSARYIVNYGGATGVTSGVSAGILTLTFGSNFNFTGDTLEISITGGSAAVQERDVKTMTITKVKAGKDGSPAVSYWLEPNYQEVMYNPEDHTFSPATVACEAYMQVGAGSAETATAATIEYQYQSRSDDSWGNRNTYNTAIPMSSGICENYRRIRFYCMVDDEQKEYEDVDILMNGRKGETGASGDSTWYLSIDNAAAGVNCDSLGNILAGVSVICHAKLFHGSEQNTGATYTVSANATGVTTSTTAGVLTISFTDDFAFDDDTLQIYISGKTGNTVRDSKVMTITKTYPGIDGDPAVSYWLEPSDSEIILDPETTGVVPSSITCVAKKIVGQGTPEAASEVQIKYQYYVIGSGWTTAHTYSGAISISYLEFSQYKFMRFIGYVGGEQVDMQDIGVLSNGRDGDTPEQNWQFSISNQNSSINCDHDGNILPGALRPSTSMVLWFGSTPFANPTFSVTEWYDGTARKTSTSAFTITYSGSTGILTIASSWTFTAATASIYLIAEDDGGNQRDTVKVMNISKTYEGDDGEPAVSYWVEPSFTDIIYDPNTSAATPSSITCTASMQVGQGAVGPAAGCTIKYMWQSRSTGAWGDPINYSGPIPLTGSTCTTYMRLRFILYKGVLLNLQQVDYQDVNIIYQGKDGSEGGQGRRGPAIRGPYDWVEVSADTRDWCNGEVSQTIQDSDKWIDVVIKDGTYYYCSTAYHGRVSPWSTVQSNWTSGDTFDFVATNLLLAQDAKINFLSGNEIYLMDGNNITGGLAGGTGTTFWAGSDSPGDAPFQVNADGSFKSTEGEIGGWKYSSSGLDWASYDGVENLNEAHLNENSLGVSYEGAGRKASFTGGLTGIDFHTEAVGETGLFLGGDDMKVVLSDGPSPSFTYTTPGVHTNMDITGHYDPGYGQLDEGLNVKTPVYVEGDMVKMSDTGWEKAAVSPFSGLKMAVITQTTTYSNYFTQSGGHWKFNTDLDTGISTTQYPNMLLLNSSDVNSSWQKVGDQGCPPEWVGMWCGAYYSTHTSTNFFRPTGIYGPTFNNRKGDTIYFEV